MKVSELGRESSPTKSFLSPILHVFKANLPGNPSSPALIGPPGWSPVAFPVRLSLCRGPPSPRGLSKDPVSMYLNANHYGIITNLTPLMNIPPQVVFPQIAKLWGSYFK